jgi:hypothetical protein
MLSATFLQVVFERIELTGSWRRLTFQMVLSAEHRADGVRRQASQSSDGPDRMTFAIEFEDVHDAFHSNHRSRPP